MSVQWTLGYPNPRNGIQISELFEAHAFIYRALYNTLIEHTHILKIR